MDFETLFWLILLGLYVLYQLVGGKKPRPRPAPAPDADAPAEAGDDLDRSLQEALREIREALGVEAPPAPEPPPAREPSSRPEWVPVEQEAWGAPRVPTRPREPAAPPSDRLPDTRDAVPAEPAAAGGPTPAQRLRHRLRERDTLREAVLLKEILDPPLSLRRPGR